MRMTDDEFNKYATQLYSGYFMGQALLEDYAARMAKLVGVDQGKILENINQIALEKVKDFQANDKQPKLPDKIKKSLEIKIPYIISVCDKLRIPVDYFNFDLKVTLEFITTQNAEIGTALTEYFSSFSRYRFCYMNLKKHGRGTFARFEEIEKEVKIKKLALDKLLE